MSHNLSCLQCMSAHVSNKPLSILIEVLGFISFDHIFLTNIILLQQQILSNLKRKIKKKCHMEHCSKLRFFCYIRLLWPDSVERDAEPGGEGGGVRQRELTQEPEVVLGHEDPERGPADVGAPLCWSGQRGRQARGWCLHARSTSSSRMGRVRLELC